MEVRVPEIEPWESQFMSNLSFLVYIGRKEPEQLQKRQGDWGQVEVLLIIAKTGFTYRAFQMPWMVCSQPYEVFTIVHFIFGGT